MSMERTTVALRLSMSSRGKSFIALCLSLAALACAGTATAARPTGTAPTISGDPPPLAKVGEAYQFVPQVNEPDGDRLQFWISNQPGWLNFDSKTGGLSGTPGTNDAGLYENIRITVTEGGGRNRGRDTDTLGPFEITVQGANSGGGDPDSGGDPVVNTPPVISGTPPAEVMEGQPYSFTPTASDAEGDGLTFSILNRPSWATFSASTGQLRGTPGTADVGMYSGIEIRVSDSKDSASLSPFSVGVTALPEVNTPPVISGTPPTEVVQEQLYSFTPTASDTDGDSLTFSIVNRPFWATFSAATGQLRGTPGAGDIGLYGGIEISVSDGTATVSMPTFSINALAIANGTATLSWAAPTERTDGSPLNGDLSAFKLYWGQVPGDYTNSVRIDNPGISSFVIENLSAGTWYFAATAIDYADGESAFSQEVSASF